MTRAKPYRSRPGQRQNSSGRVGPIFFGIFGLGRDSFKTSRARPGNYFVFLARPRALILRTFDGSDVLIAFIKKGAKKMYILEPRLGGLRDVVNVLECRLITSKKPYMPHRASGRV